MRLTVQEKLALIYTSVGSQRGIAALTGLSHQKIGRLLRVGHEGGYAENSKVLLDKGMQRAVDVAYSIHKDITRDQSKIDGLPYTSDVPIFAARMRISSGVKAGIKGDRVEARHMHWLSDDLRNQWLRDIHATHKYANVSVGSVMTLHDYNRLADALLKGKFRTDEEERGKRVMLAQMGYKTTKTIKGKVVDLDIDRINTEKEPDYQGIVTGLVQTKYTSMDYPSANTMLRELNKQLRQKHQPATGDPGTEYATRTLLQVDTRHGKDAKFRTAHPYPKNSVARKKARNTRSNQSRKTRK